MEIWLIDHEFLCRFASNSAISGGNTVDTMISKDLLQISYWFIWFMFLQLRRMQEMIAKMQAEMNQRNTPQKTQQNGEVKSQNV